MDSSLDELSALLDYEVSTSKEILPTFFELSGYPHYEDVLSNVYAFYFNPDESHKLSYLFLYSLISIIEDYTSNKKFDSSIFDDAELLVDREVKTKGGGSIDLVLFDSGDPDNASSAIIIENKVHAALYNNLDDYYNSIDVPNKIGVVLSLEKIDLKKLSFKTIDQFINITHYDLVQRIKSLLGDFWQLSSEKYLILLKDFIQNIENMSNTPQEITENVKFYFENAAKINKLIELKRESEQFFFDVIKNELLENGWTSLRLNRNTVSFRSESKNIVGYVYFDKCFGEEKKIKIEFWLNGPKTIGKWKSNNVSNQLKNRFLEIENQIKLRETTQGVEWFCFADKEYSILGLNDLDGLDQLINSTLSELWAPIIKFIEELVA